MSEAHVNLLSNMNMRTHTSTHVTNEGKQCTTCVSQAQCLPIQCSLYCNHIKHLINAHVWKLCKQLTNPHVCSNESGCV